MTERLHFHFSLSCIGEGNGNPLHVFLPAESQGRGSLVGCRLWGHTESDTTEVTQHSIAQLLISVISQGHLYSQRGREGEGSLPKYVHLMRKPRRLRINTGKFLYSGAPIGLSNELTLYLSIKYCLVLFVNHVSFTVSVTGSDARGLFCSCFFLKSLKNSF